MKNIFKRTLYALVIIVTFSSHIYAAVKDDVKLPSLDRYQLNQIGDSEFFVSIYGKALPMPEIVMNEELNTIEVIFKNSLNNIKNSNFPLDASIVSNVETVQRDNDAVIIIYSDNGNLAVGDLRGVAPTDRFTIVFMTQTQRQRIDEEVKFTQTRLPPIPLIPEFQKNTPVTIDVVGVSLTDVIRLLAEITKKNIVIDNSLPDENVTMTLRQIPLNTAIEYLKKMYDVDFAMVGDNIIMAGSRSGLARMTGREVTRAYKIAYADVAKMPALIEGVMRISENERKNITVDERLRQLYITSSPERLDEIAVVLQSLDNPGKQVLFHARIFEFSDNYSDAVDSMLNAIYDNWWFTYSQGEGRIGAIADSGIRPSSKVTIRPSLVPVDEIINGSWRMIDSAFSASQTKNIGRVLANPSVITYDGEEAKIQLTQEMGYQVRQENGAYTVEFKEAGPVLTIKPIVGRDGLITIKLDLEASEFVGRATDGSPEVSKRKVTTNVRVRDGEPFVVGGLRREVTQKNREKIPILGDIPLLGNFFRYSYNVSDKTQVVMLVVPYILDTPDAKLEGASILFRR